MKEPTAPGEFRATINHGPFSSRVLLEVVEGKEALRARVVGRADLVSLNQFTDWEELPKPVESRPYWWRCPRGHWHEGGEADPRAVNCLKCDRPMTPLYKCDRSDAWRDRELTSPPPRRITHRWTSEPPREGGLWLMTQGEADEAYVLRTHRVDGLLYQHWETKHPTIPRPEKGLTVAINRTEAVDVATMGARWLRIGEVP